MAWAQKDQKPKATTKLQPHRANSRPAVLASPALGILLSERGWIKRRFPG